jgi:hypothetical protein
MVTIYVIISEEGELEEIYTRDQDVKVHVVEKIPKRANEFNSTYEEVALSVYEGHLHRIY